MAAQSSAASQIVFEGFVPEADLDRYYASATVFAMPSRGEGFGLVYIEAMRHGLPVIASDEDAGPEIVKHGETGYTINRKRTQELPGTVSSTSSNILAKLPRWGKRGATAGRNISASAPSATGFSHSYVNFSPFENAQSLRMTSCVESRASFRQTKK